MSVGSQGSSVSPLEGTRCASGLREAMPCASGEALPARGPADQPEQVAGRRRIGDALVIAAFPPGAGIAGAIGPCVAARLAEMGWRVHGVSVAGTGGDAHMRLNFSTATGLRAFEREIADQGFDVVFLDPAVLFFRETRRFVHLVVTAIQLGVLWRRLAGARRAVVLRREPRGFWPSRVLARLVLRLQRDVALEPDASVDALDAALSRALGGDPTDGAARHAASVPVRLAQLGPEASPPEIAGLVTAAAAVARRRGINLVGETAGAGGGSGDPAMPPCPAMQEGTRDPIAVSEAPDPVWTVDGVTVTRLMVHMRASLRALPKLRPGTQRAARRLAAWYEGAMRRVAGRGLPHFLGTASEPDSAVSVHAQRLEAWWRDLSLTGGLGSPLVAAGSPDQGEVERLANALSRIGAALAAGAPMPRLAQEDEAILAAPVANGAGAVSGMELALALMAGGHDADAASGFGWRSDIGRRLLGRVASPRNGLGRFATDPASTDRPELTLIGLTSGGSGLAENLGMTRRVLRAAGIESVTRSIDAGLARVDDSGGSRARPDGPAVRRSARLIHVNADLVPQVLLEPAMACDRLALNIGFLLWEFGVLPEAHRLALDMLDEVWCPTAFVADTYCAAGRVPVHRIGKAVTLGPVEQVGRAGLGIPEDVFLFFVSFDFHSSVERKNPLAAVRAFRRAFPPARRDVALVIKTTEVARGHWGDPRGQWKAILDLARHDARIVVLTGRMPLERYLALIFSTDCLVSPHRAEGFGYGPAQAMLLERPVIVTDYSGTRDFCTDETSFPVRADLVPVRPGESMFPMEGAVWAAVDEIALAETMRRVLQDRSEAGRRARAGRALIETEYSVAAHAARCLDRLTALGVIERGRE